MSNKCDVVVVGGGISGQWRLRALLPPPRLRQVAALGGTRGGRAAGCPLEPLDNPCAGGDLDGPKRRTRNPPSGGEGFGGPLPSPDRSRRMSFEGLGLDFELLPRQLPSLRLLEFSKRRGRGERAVVVRKRAGERLLLGGGIYALAPYALVSPLPPSKGQSFCSSPTWTLYTFTRNRHGPRRVDILEPGKRP